MNWLWIPFVILCSSLALVELLRPAWLMRGHELTDSKREKVREVGMTTLGACALVAWPNLLGKDFPYVFGPIALLWLIVNFKTIARNIPSALLAVGVFLWMVLALAFKLSS